MEQFNFEETVIKGVYIITPNVYGDDRGYFMEVYQKDLFAPYVINREFVQDNESRSSKGVLRGLHFQTSHTQGKLVRVTKGTVYDVAVDVRPGSPTFGKYVGCVLSDENKKIFWIPEGFAHGFLVLHGPAEFAYKCTDVYDPAGEGGIPFDDPDIGIEWPQIDGEYQTSSKDKTHLPFKEQDFSWAEKWL